MKYIFKKKKYLLMAAVIDAIGYPLKRFFGLFSGKPVEPKVRSFLIIRLDHMGDILLTTPIPKMLKENFAGCRVTYLAPSWGEPLLINNPFIDEIIVYDTPWFAKGRYGLSKRSSGFTKTASLLRSKKFTTALGLRGDIRENLLMWVAGIPERLGYGITGGGFWLTRELEHRENVHESEYSKDILAELGVTAAQWLPKLYYSPSEETSFEARFLGLGLSPREKYVGLLIDAGAPNKEWPEESQKEFICLFHMRYPHYKIALIGTDIKKAERLSGSGSVNLVGRTTVRDIIVLVKYFQLFVGPDSGPTHIAAAAGVPTLFLYSGTNSLTRWRPLFENAEIIKSKAPCGVCPDENQCIIAGHPCMSDITAEEVSLQLEKRLR